MKKRPFLSHSLQVRYDDKAINALSLESQMGCVFALLNGIASTDPMLVPERWLISTGERDSSYLYQAFDKGGPTPAALAVIGQGNKKNPVLQNFSLWNGEEDHITRATISCLYNRQDGRASSLTLNMDSKPDEFRLGPSNATTLLTDAAHIYSPIYCSLGPEQYDAVFPDRPGVAWMIYLRSQLTIQQVPEARALLPVVSKNEKGKEQQIGTIVVSVTDAAFSDLNPEHVKIANAIEIRLVDQDLLPRFVDV